jgi:prolyl-tRNA synthetase
MRMSHMFGRTLREAPADAEIISHQLMVRAGMIRPLGSGLYSLMPLGYRVIKKIEQIIREEMDAIGGQELLMPVVHPADLWKESGRYYAVGPELTRFKDRADRDMVLAMTHEEIVADLARHDINSYRQLPQIVYHLQTKWRDEPRARAGLIRVREFTMKDSYSLDLDEAGLEVSYQKHYEAYNKIFGRIGFRFIVVSADVGMMGGSKSEEFMAFSPNGEDTLLICPNGDYAANREVAVFNRPAVTAAPQAPLEKIETPNTPTIEALCKLLGITKDQTAKAVFFEGASGKFIFAVIRGDYDINETKLRQLTGESDIVPASAEVIRAHGAEPGYGSPIGVTDAVIVVDESIAAGSNFVAGANEPGYHYRNVNLGRDFEATILGDIAAAAAGMLCVNCGATLTEERAIEIGNIFKLGSRYSEKMEATYLDAEGRPHPIVMGSYGIGSGRAAATIVEQSYDEKGIIWPVNVAPYQIALLSLAPSTDTETTAAAEALWGELVEAGFEVLFDDRQERPGVKFNDADLIGLPIRLSVSPRTLANNQVEMKARKDSESVLVDRADIITAVRDRLDALRASELTYP